MNINFISPTIKHLKSAEENFAKGEYEKALLNLKWGFKEDNEYQPLYQLAIQVLDKLEASEEKNLFENALANFKQFQPFYDLGYHFIDIGNYDLAQSFYEKALKIDPSSTDTAYELSLAYSARFNTKKALEVLENTDISYDFWAIYRLHQCKIWNNQTEGVKGFIEQVKKRLQQEDRNDDTDFAKEKIEELEEVFSRYNLLGNPETHIREWHFIQHGAAVLDYFEDTEEYVAGGRYVALWGTMESVREVLEKLRLFLITIHKNPIKVLSLPDRNSEIISKAVSILLKTDFEFLTEENINEENIIIVAGDNDSFNGVEKIFSIQKNQTVFSLNLNWFNNAMISPDIAGFMTQTYSFPWEGGGLRIIDDETQKIERTEPDNRAAEVIADQLVNIEPEINQEFQDTLNFYTKVQDYLKGSSKDTQKRLNFIPDSPVPASYFT